MEKGETPHATGTVSVRTYLSADDPRVDESQPFGARPGEGGIRTQEAMPPQRKSGDLHYPCFDAGKESRAT